MVVSHLAQDYFQIKEDVDSYSWLLTKFVECMVTPPKMIITDQDHALIISIENVLPTTRHRFCMWHIMVKVAEKVPIALKKNVEFAKAFNKIVWTYFEEPFGFEQQWEDLMYEYRLTGNKWFDMMFELRSFWTPSYFRELQFSGLFRTTSLSESENSFFRKYLDHNANLVEFFMRYESAIDAQRNTHDRLSIADKTYFPQLKTYSDIEHHASLVYTKTIFLKIQEEIEAAYFECSMLDIRVNGDEKIYDVDDNMNGTFYVTHNTAEDYISCSCAQLIRLGHLCRHIFVVMKNMQLKAIPEKYIFLRWSKIA